MSQYIHASALIVGEHGILIRGASGSGKSRLTLALLSMAADTGEFARLVGDDRVLARNCAGQLIVRPHPAIAGRIEQRSIGIVRLPYEPATVIRLVVDLTYPDRMPVAEAGHTVIAAVSLPIIALWSQASVWEQALAVFSILKVGITDQNAG